MAESYSTICNTLETILSADARLEGVHITQELDSPTVDQCPAVLIALRSSNRVSTRIVAGSSAGTPNNVTITIELQIWTFSGQGTKDAARNRDDVLAAVIAVLEDNPSLQAVCHWAHADGVAFQISAQGSGIFAAAALTVSVLLLA